MTAIDPFGRYDARQGERPLLELPGRTIRDDLIRACNHAPTARMPARRRKHREHFEMSQMVAVAIERTTATRKLVGVICSSRRASVVGPQERRVTVCLGRGAIPGIFQPRITPIKSIS